MSIVEFGSTPPWSGRLDAEQSGESTKCLWVKAMGLTAWG